MPRQTPVAQCGSFNTQPPEGGWSHLYLDLFTHGVSTHSRLKAAEHLLKVVAPAQLVSTHSRLKAAAAVPEPPKPHLSVSTHSRLKAAGIAINL